MKVCVLLTCFNRKDKTIQCIKSLMEGNTGLDLHFVVVDDGSLDGTKEALYQLRKETSSLVDVYSGDGNLFYSGGMRVAMEKAGDGYDYYVLVNDDVLFYKGILEKIITEDETKVIVGPTCDREGKCSYGGIRYIKGIRYKTIRPTDHDRSCDTFNANMVVIPGDVFRTVPKMDEIYRHSLGDFDYGLQIKRAGFGIEVADCFVGVCENNSSKGTWRDNTLSLIERIRKKESVKGAPFKPWFHFLNKNFGLGYAILYSITPYIRILIRK